MAERKGNVAISTDTNNSTGKNLTSETEDEICSDQAGSLSPNVDDSDVTGM